MNTLTVTSDVKGTIKQLHFNLWDSARNDLHLTGNNYTTLVTPSIKKYFYKRIMQ